MVGDTAAMSLHALVAEAGQALNAARGLFGPAPQGPVWSSTSGLAQGRQGVTDVGQLASQSWLGAGGKQFVASNAAQAAGLDAITDADGATAPGMPAGAKAAGAGGAGMDGVIDNTRSGVAAIAPSTGTPAGKVELVNHLQGQLDRAKALLKASERRNIALAQMLRGGAAGYGGGAGGGSPMGGMSPMGGGGGGGMGRGGGMGMPDFSGFAALGRRGSEGQHDLGDPQFPWSQPQGPTGTADMAVKAAMTKLGKPYVWGAKGPNAFDCSGLVHWSYGQAGVTVGGDTYSLIKEGTPVAPGDVRRGDAIFPSSSFGEMGKAGPGHVMLAISPTQVIEAQQTGVPIKISPMPKSFVARRLAG